MDIPKLRLSIMEKYPGCRACEECIDTWPDADPSEEDAKVVYVARSGLFVGICSQGHVNEFYLPEVKAGEIVAHDVSERTLGRFTTQDECGHEKSIVHDLPEDQIVPAKDGPIEGPAKVRYCGLCGMRKRVRSDVRA
jgi:hypothetical protein